MAVGGEFLQCGARWLLLFLLFYAPWAYGSTRPALVDVLDDGLLCSLALHVLGLLGEWRRPRYPLVPTICFVLLVLQGAWMCLNARSILDEDFWEFVALAPPFPGLPGSWDKWASLAALKTVGAMAGAFLVACDLMADRAWKQRLWCTMAVAGCSVVFYGLLLKGLGSDSAISMYHGPEVAPLAFGPYRYHANAGAFLNFVWPVVLVLFIDAWRQPRAYAGQTVWSCGLALAVAACFVNTSKGAATISVVMLAAAAVLFLGFFQTRPGSRRSQVTSRVIWAVFLLGFAAIVVYGGLTSQLQVRWDVMVGRDHAEDISTRLLMYGACLRMLPEAGWLGFGPGTFASVFPFHTQYLGDKIQGFWLYAHEDYLQTVIEYGWLGAAIWSVLFFGSIFHGFRRGADASRRTLDRLIYRASALALAGVAVHSLFDFPLQVASIELYATVFFAYAWSQSPPRELTRDARVSRTSA